MKLIMLVLLLMTADCSELPLPCIIVVDGVLELVVPEKTTISKPTLPKTKVYYTLLGQKLTNIEFYKGIYIEINEKNESIIKIK